MADQILGSYKCGEAPPCWWEFSYLVESAGKTNQFCVVVKADEMEDATDAAEAKTLANAKASAIKTAWVAALAEAPATPVVNIAEPENVTL
jgi:hypothetical protein